MYGLNLFKMQLKLLDKYMQDLYNMKEKKNSFLIEKRMNSKGGENINMKNQQNANYKI